MRLTALFALVILGTPAELWSQQCVTGRPTAREEWVEPHAVSSIARHAPGLLEDHGWQQLSRSDSGRAVFLRAMRWDWPRPFSFDTWRTLTYPGANVRVSLRPFGPWTRISVTVELRCQPTYEAPAGTTVMTSVADHIAKRTLDEVVNPLASLLQEARSEVPGDDCEPLRDSQRKTRICHDIARRRMDDMNAQLAFALALIRYPIASVGHDPIARILELGGNDRFDVLWKLATTFLEEHHYPPALSLFDRMAVNFPDSLQVHEYFGITLGRAEDWEHALESLEFAITRGSIEPEVFYIAGLGYALTGDTVKMRERLGHALLLYRQVIPLRATNAQAWADMGLASSIMGRHAEAVSLLGRAQLIDGSLLTTRPQYQRALEESLLRAGPQPPATLRRRN